MDGRTALRAWLEAAPKQRNELAAELGVSPETVSRWLSGRLIPSIMARVALEYVTGGKVPRTSPW